MTRLSLVGIYCPEVSEEERRFITSEVTSDPLIADQELARLVLVEVEVRDAVKGFEVALLGQSGSDQAPWLERYFSEDGSSFLGEDTPALPNFRVCFYLHYFDAGQPIHSPFGQLNPKPLTGIPLRLRGVCVYEHPG